MNSEDYQTWLPRVEKVARSVARDFPDSAYEDLAQAVWEGLLRFQLKLKMLDPNQDYVDSALFYLARSEAWKERKQHLMITAQYAYRTTDVRALLRTYFDREDWYDATVPADAYSELGSVALEMSADLSRAWDKLAMSHKVLIFRHFGLGQAVDNKKLSRAIARMADIINTYQTPKKGQQIGTRPVMTNAAAHYLLSNQDH